jgi:hypothetical protein
LKNAQDVFLHSAPYKHQAHTIIRILETHMLN